MFAKLFARATALTRALYDESGQDLFEYALILALIAFGVTAGMRKVANSLNTTFTNVATTLTTNS